VYVVSRHYANVYSRAIPTLMTEDTKEPIMHTTIQATSALRHAAAEQSYQDYLRISQNARSAAIAARRAASTAFWAAVAGAIRSMGEHASVRLGAGHHVQHMEG
jgi:vacuolar-type H+-ATPase catalytic subunit A/Vma1